MIDHCDDDIRLFTRRSHGRPIQPPPPPQQQQQQQQHQQQQLIAEAAAAAAIRHNSRSTRSTDTPSPSKLKHGSDTSSHYGKQQTHTFAADVLKYIIVVSFYQLSKEGSLKLLLKSLSLSRCV